MIGVFLEIGPPSIRLCIQNITLVEHWASDGRLERQRYPGPAPERSKHPIIKVAAMTDSRARTQ